MSGFALSVFVLFALFFDLLSFIPGVGTFFIGMSRVLFWFNGYNAKGTLATTVVAGVTEIIPLASVLPACTLFVVLFYLKNQTNTKVNSQAKGIEETIKSKFPQNQ